MKQRVLLKGNEAIDLLHRISTVDLKKAPRLPLSPGLLLNPQGKILSFFEIELLNPEEAVVEFEDRFLEILDQYTFGEKYEIIPEKLRESTAVSESGRISQLIPLVGHEFQSDGTINPLEVNLKSAIHDQKGCYPGQEVIEKIISLGSPAKKLCLLKSEQDFTDSLPAILKDSSGTEAGQLTSFHSHQGLAILKRNYLKEGTALFAGSIPFTVQKVSP